MPRKPNPESYQARRNRDLCRQQRTKIAREDDRQKSRYMNEIDNTVDEGFSEQCAHYGTNAGRHVNIPAPWLPTIINGKVVASA